jgi:hypothetical protein
MQIQLLVSIHMIRMYHDQVTLSMECKRLAVPALEVWITSCCSSLGRAGTGNSNGPNALISDFVASARNSVSITRSTSGIKIKVVNSDCVVTTLVASISVLD